MKLSRIWVPLACMVAAALAITAPALAAPKFTVAFAEHPYTFATPCDPAKSLVFVNMVLRNGADTPTGPVHILAQDGAHALEGDLTLPQIPAHMDVQVAVSLHRSAASVAPLVGTHPIALTIDASGTGGKQNLAPLDVAIPATFCVAALATPTPAPAAAPASFTPIHSRVPIAALTTPTPLPRFGANASKVANISVLARPAVPTNVKNVAAATDCGAHVGVLGALTCPAMIASGDLLLIWDWKGEGALTDIDGYHIYRVDSGLKTLVATRSNGKDLTLFDIAPPAGGYSGKCYSITAYTAKAESESSSAFCASGGAVAKTVRMPASQARSSTKRHDDAGNTITGIGSLAGRGAPPAFTNVMVGYSYASEKHTLGDSVLNVIYRGAVAFDLTTLAKRRVVSARLHLQIADSKCLGCVKAGGISVGNNYSCITTIGSGNEFWWRNGNWIEIQPSDIEPNDVGPDISADVTKLVASWVAGEPNYGFVLLNRDERLGAFDNRQCQTSYSNPVLEITYY